MIALVVALLGLSVRSARGCSPLQRLASEPSYVAHLPLIVFLQVTLALAPLPGLLKYALVVASTTAICLATYELAIRRTRLRCVLG